MSKLHPAIVNHIQAMQDDLADMMDNPDDYEYVELVELTMLLLDLYEDILDHFEHHRVRTHRAGTLMEIVIPYAPRPLQFTLHAEMQAKRWGVVVCHRRFGKTVWAINHILRDAIMCDKTAPRYAYMAPTYRQAKNVAWDYLKQFAGGIPGVKFHETELRCDLADWRAY
jgi:hypothetical protein